MEELLKLLQNFFIYASYNKPSALIGDSTRSIYTTSYVPKVLYETASIMNAVSRSLDITERFNSHLDSIADEIRRHRGTANGDYLVWTASLYLSYLNQEWCVCDGVVYELQEYKRSAYSQYSGIRQGYFEELRQGMSECVDGNFFWDFLRDFLVPKQTVSMISSTDSVISKGILNILRLPRAETSQATKWRWASHLLTQTIIHKPLNLAFLYHQSMGLKGLELGQPLWRVQAPLQTLTSQ